MILWYTRDEPSCYLRSSFRLESRSYDHITSRYELTLYEWHTILLQSITVNDIVYTVLGAHEAIRSQTLQPPSPHPPLASYLASLSHLDLNIHVVMFFELCFFGSTNKQYTILYMSFYLYPHPTEQKCMSAWYSWIVDRSSDRASRSTWEGGGVKTCPTQDKHSSLLSSENQYTHPP